MNSRIPSKFYLLFLVFMVVAGAVVILFSVSKYGPALSNDSIQYISIARNLVTAGKFESYLPGPVTKWPPLYPIILAIMSQVFGVDMVQAAGYLNAVSFSLLIAGAGFLAAILLGYPYYMASLATMLIFSSGALITTSVYAWTEPLFIALSLLFLIGLHAYLQNGRFSWLVLMIISTALACLTRYMGFTFIIAGIGVLLLFPSGSLRSRIKVAALFALISGLPLGLWLIRNYLIANNLAGNRTIVSGTFVQNFHLAALIIAGSIKPGGLALLVALFGIVLGIVIGLRFNKLSNPSSAPWREIGPVIVYIISYLAGLLIVTSSIELTPIDDRYMSPVFVPTIILFLYLAKRFLLSLTQKKLKLVASAIIFSWAIFLILPNINYVVSETNNRFTNGAGGLNQKGWQEGQIVEFLRDNPQLADRTIFTNSPDAVYFFANVNSLYLPNKSSNPEVAKNQLVELTGQWPSEESYLVWFNFINRTWMFSDDELSNIVELNDVTRFKDGAIYTISPGSNQIFERIFDIPQPKIPTEIHWGNKISLLGYELNYSPSEDGELMIHVFWQAHEEIERSYIVYFHVINPETGELVAQSDVIPRGWSYPTNQWQSGEVIEDNVRIQLSDLSPGHYSLYLGWYDSETGVRLPVISENEREVVNNSALLTVIER